VKTTSTVETTWTVRFRHEPGDNWPVIPRRFGTGRMLPVEVVVTFYQKEGQAADLKGLTVRGYRLRKDDSEGAPVTERFYGMCDLPDWLQPLASYAASDVLGLEISQ
jgi:hypothetical protein